MILFLMPEKWKDLDRSFFFFSFGSGAISVRLYPDRIWFLNRNF